MDKELSKRIWITRYLMVIGIIILHLPPYQSLSELGTSPFDLIKGFFSHGLFRATVPVLTVLSGFLIFHTGLYARFSELLNKKIKTLLIPLLLWNLPLVIAVYFAQKYNLLTHGFSAELYPFDIMKWLNATLGVAGTPVNYPLNFLRDLFVIALLSPVFGLLLNRIPYIGLAVIGVIYFFNLDGPLVLRNSMIISFYIGGLAAIRKWDVTRLDRFAWPLLGILLLLCLAITVYDIENREYFRMVSPFLIWPAISLIANTRFGEIVYQHSQASFFTFLCHGPLLLVMWLVFQKIPGDLPYLTFWLVAPVSAVLFCILANHLLKRLTPGLSSVALGGR